MSIRFELVSKRYAQGRDALTDISFEIGYGEMVYVTGHSGAGKSTLLKLLALIERPSDGSIEVFSKQLSGIRRRGLPAYRRRLGLVFQDHRLLLDRNAFDNVALPMRLDGVAEAEISPRVAQALEQVGLGGRESALPRELSTGEQQRLGIARAMVGVPDLLLADEPTGNLDPKLAAEIMLLMISLKEQGTTVIIASHDLPLIQRMRKRTLVLDGGRLIDDFRPEDWYAGGA
ncbi:MAG: ATP-binding cassette domain-containing protein [Rhodanobacteraceae bacterium]|nr:ATP-binding cassette domain-containing protein [Rhodanobacteraceae bacterium]